MDDDQLERIITYYQTLLRAKKAHQDRIQYYMDHARRKKNIQKTKKK